MLFSSISFLYFFIPAIIALYFAVPYKLKNTVLLIFSLFFYAWGGVKYALLMVLAITLGYIFGLLIEKFRENKKIAKIFVTISVACIISFMLYFKYMDFFIDNFNAITGLNIPLLKIVLPIGISFYTFQIISYVVDVYRGEKAQKNPINLAAYVAMFPQLIAGPIVRYADVARELETRTHSFTDAGEGTRRFIMGLAKKVLIANSMYDLSELIYATDEKTVLLYWMYGISIALYIYFDFSGYSDMAIGLGRIFGFHFLENFNYPFISRSATEFWRRWHMSLGSWFRDYIYIPLGGNRVSQGRWFFNILAVWFLTGFWHGADWTFIIWGLYFALFLLLEKFFLAKFFSKIPKVFSHVYVILVIFVSFVIFSGNGLSGSLSDLGKMFGLAGLPFWTAETGYYLSSYAVLLVCAIFGSTPIVKGTVLKLKQNGKMNAVINVLEPVMHVVLLLIVTAYFVDGSFSPFLYFRF